MLFRLALKDLIFDRLMSFCIVAAMVAVLAPLLLLFSLRNGIVTNLENSLKNNPVNLEIKMLAGYDLSEDFFSEIKNNPHVGFVVEQTRALSVTANVFYKGKLKSSIESYPTAKGDPLIELSGISHELQPREVFVTESLEKELNLVPEAEITVVISRTKDGVLQKAKEKFIVKGTVKGIYSPRPAIFMNKEALVCMEDYRDGFEPQLFSDGSNINNDRKYFSKARIYAKSIDDVKPLSELLSKSFNISDKLMEIENVKAINRVLSFVFFTIALTSVIGGGIALCGLIFINIGRKSRSFALLRLMGLSSAKITVMVLEEDLSLAFISYIGAYLLFYLGQTAFNIYFSGLLGDNNVVSILSIFQILCGLLITLIVSAIISLICAYYRFIRINIANQLREI